MESPKDRIAVIVPARDDEITIVSMIEGFHASLPQAAIWVIDNASQDATASYARACMARLGCAGGVLTEPRPGKGNAVRRAFLEVDADIYLLVDADMTSEPGEAMTLIAPVANGDAEMVIGDRHSNGQYDLENNRPFHGLGSRLVRFLVNKLFSGNLTDIMSGYRAFSRRFVKSYPILVEGFELETDMAIHALDKRLRDLEVQVSHKDRPEGSHSKLRTFRDGFLVLWAIFNLLRYCKPLPFYGATALLFFLLGLGAAAPAIAALFAGEGIETLFGSFAAVGLWALSIVSITVALIADSQRHHDRRDFELDLLAMNSEEPRQPPKSQPEEKPRVSAVS